MSDKEMADFLQELRNRHEMPIDEDEYYLIGEIAERLKEQEPDVVKCEDCKHCV